MKLLRLPILPIAALLLAANATFAQSDFQLPRECSERNNPNPEKCVIPDGPPRMPWVHRGSTVTKITPAPANVSVASPTPVQPPSRIVRVPR